MKTINLKSVLLTIVIVGIVFTACNKEDTPVNTPPTSPVLNSPLDASTIVGLSTALDWNPSTDTESNTIKYDVYLGLNANPTTVVATGNETTTFEASDLTNNSTYYWKVEAKDANDVTSASEIRSFITNAILGSWTSTPTEVAPNITIVQSFTFDADKTGNIEQTGDLTNSFTMTWDVSDNTLTMHVSGVGDDTVYHTFENNGNTMILKESEVTPNVKMTLNRDEG